MKKSSVMFASAIVLGVAMFAPLKASAQGVTIYIGPGYPGYAPYAGYGDYPAVVYPGYGAYPSYGYADPSYGYGYVRPGYGTYWGQGRRVARRVYRRHDRWD
jgi:hypothetical protein